MTNLRLFGALARLGSLRLTAEVRAEVSDGVVWGPVVRLSIPNPGATQSPRYKIRESGLSTAPPCRLHTESNGRSSRSRSLASRVGSLLSPFTCICPENRNRELHSRITLACYVQHFSRALALALRYVPSKPLEQPGQLFSPSRLLLCPVSAWRTAVAHHRSSDQPFI